MARSLIMHSDKKLSCWHVLQYPSIPADLKDKNISDTKMRMCLVYESGLLRNPAGESLIPYSHSLSVTHVCNVQFYKRSLTD